MRDWMRSFQLTINDFKFRQRASIAHCTSSIKKWLLLLLGVAENKDPMNWL